MESWKSISSETFYGDHNTTVLQVLDKDRYEEDSFCDATLQVKGEEFRVHRCLLGGFSEYFKKIFKCEMKEKYNKTVVLDQFSVETIKAIVDYFYTTRISISEENTIPILEAADYFQLEDIKLFCTKTLISTVSVSNCLYLRSVGEVYHCESLQFYSEKVAAKNFKKLIKENGFKLLLDIDLEKIIQQLDQKVIGSRRAYEGILSWVSHDYEKRKEHFVKLFKLVKLHLLPTKYLEENVVNHELVKNSMECKDYLLSESLHIMKHQHRKEPAFDSSSCSENEDDKSKNLSVKALYQEPSTSRQTKKHDNRRKRTSRFDSRYHVGAKRQRNPQQPGASRKHGSESRFDKTDSAAFFY